MFPFYALDVILGAIHFNIFSDYNFLEPHNCVNVIRFPLVLILIQTPKPEPTDFFSGGIRTKIGGFPSF
jgi:hypothetical protein